MKIASLSQFAKHKDGTYVSLEMTQESRDSLDQFVEMSLGLTERVDPSTYHTTVIYSRTPVPTAENLLESNPISAQAMVTGYEVFPTKSDGQCLVMRISCPIATELNAQLTKEGATSDYAEYKPHVTLAYDMSQTVNPNSLPTPQFQLTFDRIHVAPLDPEFTPENKK